MAMDYKNAGVDIEAGYESVELMKKFVKGTMRPEVLGGLGGFSGAFSLKAIKDMEDPVLLSGTDGCGTKVKLAMIMDKHDTIGIDAVAMCVNDIACAGGEPLFFLDYIACGKNYPEKIAQIVSGVAEGCGSDRWRDSRTSGSDAGRGIRSGRICRWCLRQKRDDHRRKPERRRCTDRYGIHRRTQQRIFSCKKSFRYDKRIPGYLL